MRKTCVKQLNLTLLHCRYYSLHVILVGEKQDTLRSFALVKHQTLFTDKLKLRCTFTATPNTQLHNFSSAQRTFAVTLCHHRQYNNQSVTGSPLPTQPKFHTHYTIPLWPITGLQCLLAYLYHQDIFLFHYLVLQLYLFFSAQLHCLVHQ